ncbi:MAG: branched-chain amino acid ABC transporter substrate-binding protein, partial [Acidimicrobiia bacterium]
FHAHAYDAANMLFAAIAEVAVVEGDNLTIDLQAVRDSLNGMTWEGLTGSLSCDEFGDCAAPAIFIVQNTDETADIAAVRANELARYTAEELGF